MKSVRMLCAVLLAVSLLFSLALCEGEVPFTVLDYSDPANWAYFEDADSEKPTDIFFIPTTASRGKEGIYTIDYGNPDRMAKFLGTVNMEKGIYDGAGRFFAPFYQQASLTAFFLPDGEGDVYFDNAYLDVREAFLYYLEHCNNGRPIVLAGFSQGGIMAIRLAKEFMADEQIRSQIVAVYAPGWYMTEEELAEYPYLSFAKGETDTGVIIAFTGEAPEMTGSSLIPEGMRVLAINPLNWKRDNTPAEASENPGSCFTDYSGDITSEIEGLCGCYIDAERGTLKVTGVTAEEYPGSMFEDGVFHVYDYQFFYRSLQKNVADRVTAFCAEQGK